jgi:hypothetical protein
LPRTQSEYRNVRLSSGANIISFSTHIIVLVVFLIY